MSSENNKPSNDPVELAIAAMKSATATNDRPPTVLVTATLEALRRLEAGKTTAENAAPTPPVVGVDQSTTRAVSSMTADGSKRPSRRFHRLILWAAAIAAVVLVAMVLRRTNLPPTALNDGGHRVDAIAVTEINPAPIFDRLDSDLARAQVETTALIDEAKKRLAEEQITRIIADDSKLVGSAQTN